MKRLLLAAVLLALIGPAAAEERLALQLKWLPQAQFAGYYVAKEKGYYKAAGLARISHGGEVHRGPNPEKVVVQQ